MSANCACDQVAGDDDEEKKYAYAAPLSSCRSLILLTLLCRGCEQETYIISLETWLEQKWNISAQSAVTEENVSCTMRLALSILINVLIARLDGCRTGRAESYCFNGSS